MPRKRSHYRGNSSVLLKDMVDEYHPTYRVQSQSRVATFDWSYGVPLIPTNLSLGGDTPSQEPQIYIFNAVFYNSIQLLTQLVVSLSHHSGLTCRRR